jgi:two-component sensor histidine kinase
MPLAMACVCFTVAISELITWSRLKGHRADIAFALTCLAAAFYDLACSGGYNVDTPAQSVIWLRIQLILLPTTGMSFLWYVSGKTGLVPKPHMWIFLIWFGVCAVLHAVGPLSLMWKPDHPVFYRADLPFGLSVLYREVEAGPVTIAQDISGFVYFFYLFLVVWRYRRSGFRREAGSLFRLIVFIFASYMNDLCVAVGLYSFLFTMEYAWLAAVVFVGFQRSRQMSEAAAAIRALDEAREREAEEIRASLQEKSVLLKEMHHRVKNNLQVISSLLYLQEDRIEDPHFKTIIRECRNQVFSMALIHEDLYRSENLRSLDFGVYIRNLVNRLFTAYRVEGAISFVPVVESLSFGIDKAIPCGLIVNELCTNALKYAFPDGFAARAPEIRIELRRKETGRISLIVGDNGVGLPKGFRFPGSRSLGMQIIARLVDQIGGAIRLEGAVGTCFVIEFSES